MKLKNITINNYKSFGNTDNLLFIDKLNAIIGKNESGKSNIIDCLSGIKTIGSTTQEYFLPRNRKNNNAIQIDLCFETYDNEYELFGFSGTTNITLKSFNEYLLLGEMSNYISNSQEYNTILSKIDELTIGVSFQQQNNRENINKLIENLKCANSKIFVNNTSYRSVIQSLKTSNGEKYIKLAKEIEKAITFLSDLYCIFPKFIKIEDLTLNSKYTIETVKTDKLLEKFLSICSININDLIQKMNSTDIADVKNYERNIKNNFTDKFNDFYSQEYVNIEIAINPKELNILIDTSQSYLKYDERSNGLKWYISAFIQLQYMENQNCKSFKNNIILMDEPGVYLHANAQRELVKLFSNLVKNYNQIIYTTHSPFMLNTDCIQNIRAVIKDENGISHIHNKISNIPSNLNSTYDTITPLINALGLNLNYNIGPAFNRKNLIVEGISDYFYLHAYYRIKDVQEIPNIIPSTGGDNIPAIASILFGWNCDFNILLDQDDKGHSVYDSINDSKQPFLDKLIFIDGNVEKILDKDFEIENLFSTNDQAKFGISNEDYAEYKYNYSYNAYNKILLQEDTYDETTIKNFDKLIEKINKQNKKVGD